jgi:DNA-binding NarL/FixJ family response regulator
VIASKLLQQMSEAKQQVTEVDALTPREAEVLELLAQGLQNKEIANALVISERTVKFHVSSIMGKLGASNRTEAVALAANQGLVRL